MNHDLDHRYFEKDQTYDPFQPHEYLTNDLLTRLVLEDKVSLRRHAEFRNLVLFKYRGGYDFFRDEDCEIVKLCRGLVWNERTEKIVANVMPKFHNHFNYKPYELEGMFRDLPFTVWEKIDGSCVYAWWYGGRWQFSTLGSFDSEQSREARKVFEECCSYDRLNKDLTYAFEVIYPRNRIVLDYRGERSLRLLTCRNRETQEEYYNEHIPGISNAKRKDLGFEELLDVADSGSDMEGYVVGFHISHSQKPHYIPEVLRVKFKTRWYFERSKMIEHIWRGKFIRHLGKRDLEGHRFSQEELNNFGCPNVYRVIDETWNLVEGAVSGLIYQFADRKQQAEIINGLGVPRALKSALFASLDFRHSDKVRRLVWKAYSSDTVETIEESYKKNRRELCRV